MSPWRAARAATTNCATSTMFTSPEAVPSRGEGERPHRSLTRVGQAIERRISAALTPRSASHAVTSALPNLSGRASATIAGSRNRCRARAAGIQTPRFDEGDATAKGRRHFESTRRRIRSVVVRTRSRATKQQLGPGRHLDDVDGREAHFFPPVSPSEPFHSATDLLFCDTPLLSGTDNGCGGANVSNQSERPSERMTFTTWSMKNRDRVPATGATRARRCTFASAFCVRCSSCGDSGFARQRTLPTLRSI